MASNVNWDDYLAKSTPPRGPQHNFLQGTLRTPSFNEEQARSKEFTREWAGEDGLAKRNFEDRYAPGGSTIPRGETER